MKRLLAGILALFSIHTQADIITLVSTNTAHVVSTNVPTGSFVTLLWAMNKNGANADGDIRFDFGDGVVFTHGNINSLSEIQRSVAGPVTVSVVTRSGVSPYLATFEIKPQAFDVGQTVIVPAGTAATIHFEESFDLKTWSNTFTTNYTAGSTNRFFRLRAVRP